MFALEPQAHRLGDTEISEFFQEILRLRRLEINRGGCGTRGPWCGPGIEFLFADAYPEKVEPLSRIVFDDPEAATADILFALGLLPRLSSRTSAEMEGILLRLTQHHDGTVVDWALEKMSSLYGLERHRKLFLKHCQEGSDVAFNSVAYEVNPDTILFLTELEVEAGEDVLDSESRISVRCRDALEHLRILKSPDWHAQIRRILERDDEDLLVIWAEQLAARRAPELVRWRYERNVEKGRRLLEPFLRDWSDPQGLFDRQSFPSRFAHGDFLKELPGSFDLDLATTADFGGRLTGLEKRRLQSYGLLGNSETRLIRWMKSILK